MIVAGCDVGSLTAKVVIMNDGKILASPVIRSKPRPEESAKEVMDMALSKAGLSMDAIEYCIGTGYGRAKIPFVDDVISEIACHGKGAQFLLPTARTVIDIGGQDCKTMKIDRIGKLVKFITNDKCAAGTGRFLEVMAKVLGVRLEDLGALSARARAPVTLASTCTVWAQAEVIRNLNEGKSIEDIGASVNEAMAKRVAILANSVGVEKDVYMTGGVTKNIGVVKSLERLLGVKIKKSRVDPQVAGALGAAVFAKERLEGRAI
ncbi:MAG: acyl-CoA dehydratase activase [Thermodesulfobacteriota bacterium]|nr:acyl-CoA dehydratase activase [Thermodesulfobacteriota bacterium]